MKEAIALAETFIVKPGLSAALADKTKLRSLFLQSPTPKTESRVFQCMVYCGKGGLSNAKQCLKEDAKAQENIKPCKVNDGWTVSNQYHVSLPCDEVEAVLKTGNWFKCVGTNCQHSMCQEKYGLNLTLTADKPVSFSHNWDGFVKQCRHKIESIIKKEQHPIFFSKGLSSNKMPQVILSFKDITPINEIFKKASRRWKVNSAC